MANFSERYGYTIPSSILIRERLTEEISNGICTCYDLLHRLIGRDRYMEMEEYLWCNFLNKRLDNFSNGRTYHCVATNHIEGANEWYEKLNLIELTMRYIRDHNLGGVLPLFVANLNDSFKRLYFAYRIINNQIVEITSEEEIIAIEDALKNPSNGARKHLCTALELLSIRPAGDYRNSIKEAISAVEAVVREITGCNTLNFTELERKGVILPSVLKQAFEKLYGYTNDKSTGIRHALMDDTHTPGADEAIFMLISCSAFINYLTKKRA